MLNLAKRVNHWVWDPNEERKRLERWQQEQERLLQVLECNDMYARGCTPALKRTGDCYCLCMYTCIISVCALGVCVYPYMLFIHLSVNNMVFF